MTKTVIHRQLTGTVISDKMDKTIVIRVDRVRWNKKYHKQYRVSKKYKAHDAKNVAKIGETVSIEASRPYSKDIRWRLVTGHSANGKEIA
ncbi:MAG: 30S ribosomal protein S17 [Patescibacteria group bacterium]